MYAKEQAEVQTVPIQCKVALTIKEAAEYSNIGINKLESLLRSPRCPFVLYVGKKKLVKRKEFEKFISDNVEIQRISNKWGNHAVYRLSKNEIRICIVREEKMYFFFRMCYTIYCVIRQKYFQRRNRYHETWNRCMIACFMYLLMILYSLINRDIIGTVCILNEDVF